MSKRQATTTPHRELKEAFQEYMSEKPWLHLKDYHTFLLTHPADGTPFYSAPMGDGGQEFGVSLHMGEDGLRDMASILAGKQDYNSRSPMIGVMTDNLPGHPPGDRPTLLCLRINPSATQADHFFNLMYVQLPTVTPPDKLAAAHALQAATNLARTAGTPGSLVKPRTHPSQFHMITATLQDGEWGYTLETGALRVRD